MSVLAASLLLTLQASTAPAPTYHRDIAPIVLEHCADCHRPGEAAPFSLLSFDDVDRRSRQILTVIESGYMPPWLPSPGWGEFEAERRLRPEEIELYRRWLDSGAAEGDPAESPPVPSFAEGWSLGEPDLVVEMPLAFPVPADGPDLYRNFVLPTHFEGNRRVNAVEFRPGNRRVVHHAVVMIDSTRRCRMREAAEKDGRPGFPGMDLLGAASPDGHFLGWTPGKVPTLLPAGLGFRLLGTDDVVLQTHLLPSGKEETVQCKVGFHFTDEPARARPLQLRLGVRDLDLPAGVADFTMEDSFVVPVDTKLLAVYPHAHYLGKTMTAWAVRPDGEQVRLLLIEDWDFNWQDDYRYRTPVDLPAGTALHIRYVYDNSEANPRNPHSPPIDVHYGPSSYDEMGDLWMQLLAANEAERDALEAAVGEKEQRSRLQESEKLASGDPGSASSQFDLGLTYDLAGDAANAERSYRRALELDPKFVPAKANLATLFAKRGDREAACAMFEEVLALDPDHPNAHQNLGVLRDQLGDLDGALLHLRRAVQLDHTSVESRVNLASALERKGEIEEARRIHAELLDLLPSSGEIHYRAGDFERRVSNFEAARNLLRKAVGFTPDHAAAWGALGLACTELRDDASARIAFQRSLGIRPDPEIALGYAWLLATGETAAADAAEANQWVRQTEGRTPESLEVRALDVQAACHAAAGRFKKAERTAVRARDLAKERGDEAGAAAIEARLALYAAGKAYRRANG